MKMLLILLLMSLGMTSCVTIDCPPLPKLNEIVARDLASVGDKETHPDTWAWLNRLRIYCKQIGDCK